MLPVTEEQNPVVKKMEPLVCNAIGYIDTTLRFIGIACWGTVALSIVNKIVPFANGILP